MMDIISNPMFIAIMMGTLTYAYMWWTNENRYRKKPALKKPVNIYIPAIVTFVTWAIVYGYYLSMDTLPEMVREPATGMDMEMKPQLASRSFKLIEDKGMSLKDANRMTEGLTSESAKSYQLVGRGLNIPNNMKLPDVFIETY